MCGTKCVPHTRSSGHQGAARERGSGRVALRIALHGARQGDRGRRGTERQEAGNPATRDEGQGKVSEGEQTGGRTGPGGRGREGGRGGALPRELLRTVLALAGGQSIGDRRAEKGATRCPTTERAARSARGHWARRGAAACCHKAARPQKVQCAVCLRSVMHRGPARTSEEDTGRAKEVGHLGGERRPESRGRERERRGRQGLCSAPSEHRGRGREQRGQGRG